MVSFWLLTNLAPAKMPEKRRVADWTWVCLKMGETSNWPLKRRKMVTNNKILGHPIFRQTRIGFVSHLYLFSSLDFAINWLVAMNFQPRNWSRIQVGHISTWPFVAKDGQWKLSQKARKPSNVWQSEVKTRCCHASWKWTRNSRWFRMHNYIPNVYFVTL